MFFFLVGRCSFLWRNKKREKKEKIIESCLERTDIPFSILNFDDIKWERD